MSVRAYAPSVPGVYGISNAREWIYIGIADNIQGKLLDHLRDQSAALMGKRPTGFVYEACQAGGQQARCARLVGEYAPACHEL